NPPAWVGRHDYLSLQCDYRCRCLGALAGVLFPGNAAMRKSALVGISLSVSVAVLVTGISIAQDKYTVKVPNGLGFDEFRGSEDWPVIAISELGGKFAVILGNQIMIDAYKAGVPDNGKPFPDGARMAKIHWIPKKQTTYPGQPNVPGIQHDADFMVKDS